jgi:NAD(P)-dependent dehydrogenase (short-subunit alcohol dehydrogenase family)
MAFPFPVKYYHTDTYPAIDPTSPRLSTKGKNVVITGGGSGIGKSIALSFAKSGAFSTSILGRTAKTLIETHAKIKKAYPKTTAHYYIADIEDSNALVTAFKSIQSTVGSVHILVANAGYLTDIGPIDKINPVEWFKGFEINVKGNFNLVNAFITVATKGASIISISTVLAHLPHMPGYSSYHTSKLVAAKLFDYVHYENPDLFVLNVHPGTIDTAMNKKSLAAGHELPLDQRK